MAPTIKGYNEITKSYFCHKCLEQFGKNKKAQQTHTKSCRQIPPNDEDQQKKEINEAKGEVIEEEARFFEKSQQIQQKPQQNENQVNQENNQGFQQRQNSECLENEIQIQSQSMEKYRSERKRSRKQPPIANINRVVGPRIDQNGRKFYFTLKYLTQQEMFDRGFAIRYRKDPSFLKQERGNQLYWFYIDFYMKKANQRNWYQTVTQSKIHSKWIKTVKLLNSVILQWKKESQQYINMIERFLIHQGKLRPQRPSFRQFHQQMNKARRDQTYHPFSKAKSNLIPMEVWRGWMNRQLQLPSIEFTKQQIQKAISVAVPQPPQLVSCQRIFDEKWLIKRQPVRYNFEKGFNFCKFQLQRRQNLAFAAYCHYNVIPYFNAQTTRQFLTKEQYDVKWQIHHAQCIYSNERYNFLKKKMFLLWRKRQDFQVRFDSPDYQYALKHKNWPIIPSKIIAKRHFRKGSVQPAQIIQMIRIELGVIRMEKYLPMRKQYESQLYRSGILGRIWA